MVIVWCDVVWCGWCFSLIAFRFHRHYDSSIPRGTSHCPSSILAYSSNVELFNDDGDLFNYFGDWYLFCYPLWIFNLLLSKLHCCMYEIIGSKFAIASFTIFVLYSSIKHSRWIYSSPCVLQPAIQSWWWITFFMYSRSRKIDKRFCCVFTFTVVNILSTPSVVVMQLFELD